MATTGGTVYSARPIGNFALACADVPGHGGFALALFAGQGPREAASAAGREHARRVGERVASAAAGRFSPEAIAYVRGLPPERRSRLLDDANEEWAEAARDDVRRSLERALLEDDAFRAAVEFERATPYLRADVGLVRLMARFVPEVARADWPGHAAAVASDMEEEVVARSGFASRIVSAWRVEEGSSSRSRMS